MKQVIFSADFLYEILLIFMLIGLTFIAGRLLILAPDEDAFWIFVSLMDTHLRPWFSKNTIQMEVDASLFSKALENNDAQVAKKLYVDLGISQSSVCRPWYVKQNKNWHYFRLCLTFIL